MQSYSIILITLFSICCCNTATVITLKMHHRFSEPVKKWSENIHKFPAGEFPTKGTVEFYSQLAYHDRVFRGRGLSDSGQQRLTFSDGNSSIRIKDLAYLHYTTISLGTPGQKFFVALDTGSDLFWVPCECSRCALIDNTPYSSKFNMSIYDPKESSTSKKVGCKHRMCTASCPGSGTLSTCPYSSSYVSSQTSTSEILIEDFLHLETDDMNAKIVNAFVTFGCGQVQSGSFLHVAAPNGIFGLGMEKISVPSFLAREGYIADSFSMCFGHDGIGRISFGDKGSIDQQETPFSFDASYPTYSITATQFCVGDSLINSSFTALFDSGTSFTYLVDPHYTRLTKMFHAQTKDSRRLTGKGIPFEYCYAMSLETNISLIPDMFFTMKGEGGTSLSSDYYSQTCPNAESLIRNAVEDAATSDKKVPAALLRMHFHDCFIRGCDASVLLDSKGNNQAEKDGPPNRSLHAFYVIDNAKKAVESACPGIVSCADILALAARDSVVLTGGPSWDVPKGRKDGRTSLASETVQLPGPTFNITQLKQSFAQRGLSLKDLVALSGGHTLGFSHCSSFKNRLYNFNSTTPVDPQIEPSFAKNLRSICPANSNAKNAGVTMDPSSTSFDNTYYKLIFQQKGLFSSDTALLDSPITKNLASEFASSDNAFKMAFIKSMIKMSSITGGQEVRKDCKVVN